MTKTVVSSSASGTAITIPTRTRSPLRLRRPQRHRLRQISRHALQQPLHRGVQHPPFGAEPHQVFVEVVEHTLRLGSVLLSAWIKRKSDPRTAPAVEAAGQVVSCALWPAPTRNPSLRCTEESNSARGWKRAGPPSSTELAGSTPMNRS